MSRPLGVAILMVLFFLSLVASMAVGSKPLAISEVISAARGERG